MKWMKNLFGLLRIAKSKSNSPVDAGEFIFYRETFPNGISSTVMIGSTSSGFLDVILRFAILYTLTNGDIKVYDLKWHRLLG